MVRRAPAARVVLGAVAAVALQGRNCLAGPGFEFTLVFLTGPAASPAVVDFVICVSAAKQPLTGCAERGMHSFLLTAEAGLTAGGPGQALVSPELGKRPLHDPALRK
jgi:hypothetical protein